MGKKQVANKESTEVAKVNFDTKLSEDQRIDSDEIIIPKILLMQQMSDFVQDEKAKSGEFRHSRTGELYGEKDTAPISLILFKKYRIWYIFDVDKKGNKEYKESIDYYGNEELEFEEEGIARQKVTGFYGLLIKNGKVHESLPFVIDFKGMSYRAGNELLTTQGEIGIPWHGSVVEITSEQQENDKGKFYVKRCKIVRRTSQDEVMATEKWMKMMKDLRHRVDESDAEAVKGEAAPTEKVAAGADY